MTKISIIIPFQNVENYITKCLSSVVNQTLKDIEIICINDGSKDESYTIVEDFAKNDNRITILNTNKPSGQAHARNLGLKVASGEYIGFVDSDDWIELDMFEKMYNKAKSEYTDITMCQAKLYDDKTNEFSQTDYYDLKNLEKFGNSVFSPYDAKDEILNINVVLWNKIYKREFLEQIGETFPEGYIYEDLPFFFGTFLKAKRINIIWESLYYYRRNRKFSTMQNADKKIYDRIPMVSLTYNKLKEAEFYKEKEVDILSWIVDDIFHRFTLLEEKYYKDYFYMMKKLFQSFNLEGDDIYKLACCYCFEEYCNIIKNNYFDFWKFLIEKYKNANKKVKLAQHERNVAIKDLNKFWEEKEEKDIKALKEKIEDEKSKDFELKLENEKIKYENEKTELEKQYKLGYKSLEDKKNDEINKITSEYKTEISIQEKKLKKLLSESIREEKELLKKEYDKKLEKQKAQYKKALKMQQEYYENNFLSVKIIIKFQKFLKQLKNRVKKIFKKN